MASFSTQSDLVVQTVRDLNDLRTATYNLATDSLEDLKDALVDLPLTVIDTNIGTSVSLRHSIAIDGANELPEIPYPTEDMVILQQEILDNLSVADNAYTDAFVYLSNPLTSLSGVETPEFITIGEKPIWSVSGLTGVLEPTIEYPSNLSITGFSDITTTIPLIDISALSAEFSFNNPTYIVELSDLKTGISGVLNGNLGLPDAHWDAVWTKAASDIAKLQVTKARRNRNSGAASWWSLPSETVLSKARELADETTRSLQLDRLEKAIQEAVFAREDFWKGIETALKYEELFINIHIESAKRELQAAIETVNALIAVYNVNIAGYNFILEKTKAEISIEDIRYKALANKYQTLINDYSAKIEKAKTEVDLYKSKIDGYKVDKELLISNLGEQIKYFNSQVDKDFQYRDWVFKSTDYVYRQNIESFIKFLDPLSNLAAKNVDSIKYPFELSKIAGEIDSLYNSAEIGVGELIVRSQEAKSRIDVAQAQWANSIYIENYGKVSEFNYSYAQAIATVSDVSLSAGTSIDLGQQWNASQNEDLAWSGYIAG